MAKQIYATYPWGPVIAGDTVKVKSFQFPFEVSGHSWVLRFFNESGSSPIISLTDAEGITKSGNIVTIQPFSAPNASKNRNYPFSLVSYDETNAKRTWVTGTLLVLGTEWLAYE